MTYEEIAMRECRTWQAKMMKKSNILNRTAKGIQKKINEKIPTPVHRTITEAVKKITQAALLGSKWTTKRLPVENLTLKQREDLVRDKIKSYKRIATVEGAGTGAGGLWLALADFPALLSIKMKFLFDVAAAYGFDVRDYRERLFILYVFQTAFSSDEKRQEAFLKIKNWEETMKNLPDEKNYMKEMDWLTFQQEYRDYIDLAKLLQLVPGFGAIVGAVANYRFLDDLGHTAMNAYRMRILD
ncbi:MAG: EcsC family protein [Tuberibacillus sp.]